MSETRARDADRDPHDAATRVATHVLARRRHDVTGRFGLRATPGGFGTPAFGSADAVEVVRISGTVLVHEQASGVRMRQVNGATSRDLAVLVDVDLGAGSPSGGTPRSSVTRRLRCGSTVGAAAELADWYDLGWRALDQVGIDAREPAPIQLWPEHFDASCLVFVGPGADDRCDLGVSPGDHHHQEPYLYVGPWVERSTGIPSFWNAPFGALVPRARRSGRTEDGAAFFREGLDRLRASG